MIIKLDGNITKKSCFFVDKYYHLWAKIRDKYTLLDSYTWHNGATGMIAIGEWSSEHGMKPLNLKVAPPVYATSDHDPSLSKYGIPIVTEEQALAIRGIGRLSN